jgi:7-cyano-7-deazaguanine synthase
MSDRESEKSVAVLVSGGIDSAVLAIHLSRRFSRVYPIYVQFGLRWEPSELEGLRSFLDRVRMLRLAPLVVLDEPVSDVYGDHWSVGGPFVPGYESPDQAVFLPGRNLLLVTKAAVWCQLRGIESLALGILASNPFPDSTVGFYHSLESALNRGMGGRIRLIRPFQHLSKAEVMRLASDLPIGSTFSCINPVDGIHCGSCNKCAERRRAFRSAAMNDPTPYAVETAAALEGS